MARIMALKTNLFKLPLDEVLVDAKHGEHTHFEIINGTVELENGLVTGHVHWGQSGVDIAPDKTGIGVYFDWNKLREFSECSFLK